jgi:hypothetical protein
MKPMHKRLSHSTWLWGWARGRMRRNARGAGRRGDSSQHAQWVQRIVGCFARRGVRTGMHPEKMILDFARRPWIFFLQNFLTHMWVAGGNERSATKQRADHRPLEADLEFQGIRKPATSSQKYLGLPIFGEPARGAASRALFAIRDAVGSGKIANESDRGESTFGRSRLSRADSATVIPRTQFLARHIPMVFPAARRSLLESSAGAAELVANVTQKHRRIEERRLAASRDAGPVSGLWELSESMVTAERRPMQSRKTRISNMESGALNSPGRPEFPINVERVTDEILKQLDRRVIAARERMGRT